jgi:hypothetical protein
MRPAIEEIDALVLRVIAGELPAREALPAVVQYQRAWNPRLARWWAQRGFDGDGADPDTIPAVPTDVFRTVSLLSAERAAERVFRTSGTTAGARGVHTTLSTAAYRAGASAQWRRWVQPDAGRLRWVPIVFDPAVVTDSSLSFMAGALAGEFASGPPAWYLSAAGVDPRVVDELRSASEPVVVLSTAFALVELLEQLRGDRVVLPAGSRVVETGGFKGRTREVARDVLYADVGGALGLSPGAIISEYSMTELSSQLYSGTWTGGRADRLHAPPWCLVRAVDPATLRVLPDGEEGLLRFVDLANTSSVVAVQTSDRGVVHGDGVELLGRMPGAVPRGCSLAIEEIRALVSGGVA